MNIPISHPLVSAGRPVSLSIGTAKIVFFQYGCPPYTHFFLLFLPTRWYSVRKNFIFFVFWRFSTRKHSFSGSFSGFFTDVFRTISEFFPKSCEKPHGFTPAFTRFFLPFTLLFSQKNHRKQIFFSVMARNRSTAQRENAHVGIKRNGSETN